jgi:hypothetical protein
VPFALLVRADEFGSNSKAVGHVTEPTALPSSPILPARGREEVVPPTGINDRTGYWLAISPKVGE